MFKQHCLNYIFLMFHSILVDYAILVLCNILPEAPSNTAQEKNQAIQAMSFEF